MQHLEVSCAVRRIYRSLGFKGLNRNSRNGIIGTTELSKAAQLVRIQQINLLHGAESSLRS